MSIKLMMEVRQIRLDMAALEGRVSAVIEKTEKKIAASSKDKFEHDSALIEVCMNRIKELERKMYDMQEKEISDTGRKKRVL